MDELSIEIQFIIRVSHSLTGDHASNNSLRSHHSTSNDSTAGTLTGDEFPSFILNFILRFRSRRTRSSVVYYRTSNR
eukprot:jgi/Phyca11/508549/fgenesh2_kg.PHYCAscaffold_36_\